MADQFNIGVLALQGAFAEHLDALRQLSIPAIQIRNLEDLGQGGIAGMIIPGGESTVMGKLLRDFSLLGVLREMIASGLPVWGTCAGLILLAKSIENEARAHIGVMELCVRRNGFGRQLGSFATSDNFLGIGEIPMVFIRAPYIKEVGADVEVLARVRGRIVAARQENMLATAFHPELTKNLQVHQYFVKMCQGSSKIKG